MLKVNENIDQNSMRYNMQMSKTIGNKISYSFGNKIQIDYVYMPFKDKFYI